MHDLRKALIAIGIRRKSEKIQQRIQAQINAAIKDWEATLTQYINAIKELNLITTMAEQQRKLICLRKSLKKCTQLIRSALYQFSLISELIDTVMPRSLLNGNWLDTIIKHDEQLGQMKNALAPLLLFSCNREVIEIVQKMMLQINDIQAKIKFLTEKIREMTKQTLKYGSDILNNSSDVDDE